jgi:hypothetical protein
MQKDALKMVHALWEGGGGRRGKGNREQGNKGTREQENKGEMDGGLQLGCGCSWNHCARIRELICKTGLQILVVVLEDLQRNRRKRTGSLSIVFPPFRHRIKKQVLRLRYAQKGGNGEFIAGFC